MQYIFANGLTIKKGRAASYFDVIDEICINQMSPSSQIAKEPPIGQETVHEWLASASNQNARADCIRLTCGVNMCHGERVSLWG